MKQRLIIVPIDKKAETALDYDEATKEQLIELILEEMEFKTLYHHNIFALINSIGNSNIDDYEDESIKENDVIKRIIDSLNLKKKSSNMDLILIIEKLIVLFNEALKRGTGVYFYF